METCKLSAAQYPSLPGHRWY